MRQTNAHGITVIRSAVLLVGLVLSSVPACTQAPKPPSGGPAVMSLAAATDGADSVRRVLARMRADTGYESAPGLSDDQRLMVGTCLARCSYGPRAMIQPHRATFYTREAPRDSVVIIARLINVDTIAYRKFNLHARDTVYWAIGTSRGEQVSIFYSSAPGARPYYSNLEIEDHYQSAYRQATARWIWSDHDELAWGTCFGGRCCRSDGEVIPAR